MYQISIFCRLNFHGFAEAVGIWISLLYGRFAILRAFLRKTKSS